MIKDIREKVRSYMIEESYQSYSFDDYMKLKLHKVHQMKADENKELRKGFLEEINELKEIIILLQEEYEEYPTGWIKIEKFEGCTCPRCWNVVSHVDEDGLCDRCHSILRKH